MSELTVAPQTTPAPPRLPVSLFVYIDRLHRQVADVENWVKRENRRTKRGNTLLAVYAVVVTVVAVLQAGALNWAVPLIRMIPVFFYARPDGAMEFALTTDSMPKQQSDAVIESTLWQYVMHREGYSSLEMDYNHHVVMALSDEKVGKSYDWWSSGQNKESYIRTYGDDVKIAVGLREITEYEPSTLHSEGKVTIHYTREVYTRGAKVQTALWSVTVKFIQDYRGAGFHIRDILEFNPVRVVVTGYSPPVDLSKDPAQ